MNDLEITGSTTTPLIKGVSNHLLIYGRSVPEDANKFYKPVFDWVFDSISKNDSIEIEFALDYLNSISFKIFYDIITRISNKNIKLDITWTYEEDDESILTEGEILSKKSGINFKFNPITELE